MAPREVVGMGRHGCKHLADFYVATAARGRGEVAELAAARKCQNTPPKTILVLRSL